MTRYLIGRILWLIPVLLFVSLITFTLMKLTPGGPWDRDKQLAPAVVQRLNEKYFLDRPVYEQYLRYVWGAVQGDLGPSYIYQDRNVSAILLQGLPNTASLGALAALVAMAVGIPLGIFSALRHNTIGDYAALFFATIAASVPNFVLAFLLIMIFALGLHWVPTSGWGKPQHYWLPVLTLGLGQAALLTRLTRASVLEVQRQDYIRTARAKGLHESLIVGRHLIRNALIPVVTILGPIVAVLITGSFIVENIFSIPGIGRLLIQGISQRDYSLIMGITLLYTVVIAGLNLLVDVSYALIDPRLSYR